MDNRVRVECAHDDPIAEAIRALTTHENKKREQMRRIGVRGWWAEPETISTWREENGWLTVPRGEMRFVRDAAMQVGDRLTFEDVRSMGTGQEGDIPPHRLELRPYQRDVVDLMRERENCLLKAPPASGKTTIALALAAELNVPTIVMVPTAQLMRQWVERAESELGLPEDEIGLVGSGNAKLRPLTVCIHKTLASWERRGGVPREVTDYFGCVIFDEVDQAAAPSCYAAVDPMPARYRFGVSAEMRRKDGKEFLVRGLFGTVVSEVSKRQLEAQGSLAPVDYVVAESQFEAPWYGVAEDDLDERHIDFGRLLDEMEMDPAREAVVDACIAEELERPGGGGPLLVLCHRRTHCMAVERRWIARGVNVGLMLGGPEGRAELDASIRRMREGKLRIGVGTYQAVGRGTDVPALSGVVLATPVHYNTALLNQARGRAARPHKNVVRKKLYVVWDSAVFPEANRKYGKRAQMLGSADRQLVIPHG